MRWMTEPPSRVISKRAQRRVREREKRHHRRNGQRLWPSARSRFGTSLHRLMAPREINLSMSMKRKATLLFCRRIRQAYLQEGKSVILDFSRTRRIEAVGMLVVVAEIDRCQRMGAVNQRFICKIPDERCHETMIVRQVLDQIELLDRTGHPTVHDDKSGFHATVKHWRYATGTRADENPGDVLEEHQGRIPPVLMERMQIGLMEAIVNSIHHAYEAVRDDGCAPYKEHRWWMFTHEADGKLQVLVCDLGIGFTRSLPLHWPRALLRKLTAIFTGDHEDLAAIRMALVLGVTSTEEENRGKGLPQIWNALHESDVGGVAIFSGHGHLNYSAETRKERAGSYDSSLLGTLISWQVAIEGSPEQSDGTERD